MEYTYIDYFSDNYTPEQFLVVTYAESVFEKYNYVVYVDNLNDLMMTSETYEPTDFSSLMYDCILSPINMLLETIGIFTTEDTTLRMKCDILIALKVFEELEDYSFSENTLLSTLPNVEKLATLLSDYSILEVDEYMVNIDSVETKLIDNLLAMVKPNTNRTIKLNSIYATLKQFNKFVAPRETLAILSIRHGLLVGLPFSYYMGIFSKVITTENLGGKYEDLYSIALMTVTGSNSPVMLLKDYLEEIEADNAIVSRIIKLDNDFNTFKREIYG
jgi:hypothetical protein